MMKHMVEIELTQHKIFMLICQIHKFIHVLKFCKLINNVQSYMIFSALIWFIYMILCTHIYDTLCVNKFDNVQMNTHDEFFAKISHPSCVGYVIFDKCVEINNILENVFQLSSMKYLNTTYSCKFTFNLIGHQAASKFYICAICITCHKLADLKLKRLCYNFCEPYFSEFEIKRLFSDFYSEPKMLFTCSIERKKSSENMLH